MLLEGEIICGCSIDDRHAGSIGNGDDAEEPHSDTWLLQFAWHQISLARQ